MRCSCNFTIYVCDRNNMIMLFNHEYSCAIYVLVQYKGQCYDDSTKRSIVELLPVPNSGKMVARTLKSKFEFFIPN